MDERDILTERFEANRTRLRSVAYRMLGSLCEAEDAVRASGPAIVSVFRPAMIIGSQHTPWLLEKVLPLFSFITPGKFRSIRVDQLAAAMIATAKHHPPTSAIYHYPEMMTLIARDQR